MSTPAVMYYVPDGFASELAGVKYQMGPIVEASDRALEAKLRVVLSHAKTSRGLPLPFLPPEIVKHMSTRHMAAKRWRLLRALMRFKWQRLTDNASRVYRYMESAYKHKVPYNSLRVKVSQTPRFNASLRFICSISVAGHTLRTYWPATTCSTHLQFLMNNSATLKFTWLRDDNVIGLAPGDAEPFIFMMVHSRGAPLPLRFPGSDVSD
jgi:hypothetical protein